MKNSEIPVSMQLINRTLIINSFIKLSQLLFLFLDAIIADSEKSLSAVHMAW